MALVVRTPTSPPVPPKRIESYNVATSYLQHTMELQTWNCRKRIAPDTDKPGALHIGVVLCNLESTLSRVGSSLRSKTQVPSNV